MAVDNGEVSLLDQSFFPKLAQLHRRAQVLGDQNQPAGFAVQAINQMGLGGRPKMEADAADQTGILIPLRGMTDQARLFIDNQQLVVFMNDLE